MGPDRIKEIERFDTRVDASRLAVAGSRVAFEHWLGTTEADESTVEELTVVFSELLANAVEASPGADQEIEASAWREDGTIVLRVANPIRSSTLPMREPDLGDPLRTGGRGLLIVRAYTDAVRIDGENGALVIRCERRISD